MRPWKNSAKLHLRFNWMILVKFWFWPGSITWIFIPGIRTAFGKVKIGCSVVLRCSHGNPVTFRFQAPIFMVVGQPHQSKEFKMASGKSYRWFFSSISVAVPGILLPCFFSAFCPLIRNSFLRLRCWNTDLLWNGNF